MNKNYKYIIGGIVVVVVVALVWWAVVSKGGSSVMTGAPGASSTAGSPGSPSVGMPTPPAQIVIHITAPVAGDVWKIGTDHSIAWTEAPNFTGYIYLTNAQTKVVVGDILPHVGPQQTSYSWDTRHLAASRTNPSQKDVVPGTYFITMAFDGNNLPVISSPVFTIVN
jgi:hypothetical protein